MAAPELVGLQSERLEQPVVFDLRLQQRLPLVQAVDDVFAGGVAEPDERIVVPPILGSISLTAWMQQQPSPVRAASPALSSHW